MPEARERGVVGSSARSPGPQAKAYDRRRARATAWWQWHHNAKERRKPGKWPSHRTAVHVAEDGVEGDVRQRSETMQWDQVHPEAG